MKRHFEVIIIGGGPAGLSAALMLGRCGRSVLVVDANEPRNGASPALHGYLTQDGVSPWDLRKKGVADVRGYSSVKFLAGQARSTRRDKTGFQVSLENKGLFRSRLLLLATGRTDPPPDLPGFARLFGRGVFHCPYCDGWEHRGRPLGVFGGSRDSLDLAELLLTWSRSVTIFTHGRPRWRNTMRTRRFQICASTIARLEGNKRLQQVVLSNERVIPCEALFFPTPCSQRSNIPQQLGCRFDSEGSVRCREHRAQGVPGLYVAGNVRGGVHLAITAAAEGAEAAILMNEHLVEGD